MTRVEYGPGWEMHLADCLGPDGLATLADKSVDHVVTDPPYEAEAHTLQRRVKRSSGVEEEPLNFAPITAGERSQVAEQIGRACRGWSVVFCQAEAIAAWRRDLDDGGMSYRRAIPWIKPDAMPSLHGRWPGQSFESIVIASSPGARPCPVGGRALSYSFSKSAGVDGGKAPHPTTKPQSLMRAIVEDFTRSGDLVCDPFAGSGSTGVAALMLGRRFIGWERDESYFEIACRRLRGDEAKPRAEQPSLFGGMP